MGIEETHEMGKLKPVYREYEQQKCFVGYSHKAPWSDDIISACKETLPKFDLQPWYADDQFEPTKSLRNKVVEMVANARYGIYDLSWWRANEQCAWTMPRNVLIELGMAIALNRPVLLLRHAENRVAGLQLPTCLESISQQIVDFSGNHALKCALKERLPQWLDVSPESAWWMRYCLFGQRTCSYREMYPQTEQCGQRVIRCHISDGQDSDRVDFRSLVEEELDRYSDVAFDYLDAQSPTTGYDFLLCAHCQVVRSTPFAIYRITPHTTAETFIAIGMSIALEKQFKCEIPKVIFTTDAGSVPSLLAGYEVVEAKTTTERQARLRKFIPAVMRNVRESVWKPSALPFVEFSARLLDIPSDEEKQAFSNKAEEENIIFDEENGMLEAQESLIVTDINSVHQSTIESFDDIRPKAYNKSDRLYELQMLFWKNPKQRFTTREIATKLEVSGDTALRYLNILSSTGRLPLMKDGRFWVLMEEAIVTQQEKHSEATNLEERIRHEHVIQQATPRQLEVLRAFADGLHPSDVATCLSISPSTVSTHTTVLLSLCREAWSIEYKERLDYRFLRLKFAGYFKNSGKDANK